MTPPGLSALMDLYPCILGVAVPLLSFVSWIVAMSILSLCRRSANSMVFGTTPSAFHWRILRPWCRWPSSTFSEINLWGPTLSVKSLWSFVWHTEQIQSIPSRTALTSCLDSPEHLVCLWEKPLHSLHCSLEPGRMCFRHFEQFAFGCSSCGVWLLPFSASVLGSWPLAILCSGHSHSSTLW